MVEEVAEGVAGDIQCPRGGIAEKPVFRDSFRRRRRCIIPASGFYKWTGPKTDRQPWYFTSPSGEPLAFAGLWDIWRDPETDDSVKSCTIVVARRTCS